MTIARIRVPGADFSGFGIPPVAGKVNLDALSNVQAHWSAKDTARLALSGGKVTGWADSKSGLILTDGGVSGKAPTYDDDGWVVTVGGQTFAMPCLDFDGAKAGNALKLDSGGFGSTQAIFMVVERGDPQNDSTATTQRILMTTARASGSYFYHLNVNTADSEKNKLSLGGSLSSIPNAAGPFAVGQKSIIYALISPTNGAVGLNGETPVVHDLSGATETPAGTFFGIGGQWSSSAVGTDTVSSVRNMKCKIAEVFKMTAAPNTALRQKIEGHLAWEWGIASQLPVGHPYRLTPPSA